MMTFEKAFRKAGFSKNVWIECLKKAREREVLTDGKDLFVKVLGTMYKIELVDGGWYAFERNAECRFY